MRRAASRRCVEIVVKIDQCHFGDCRESMRGMIAAGLRAQTIVTSPPYWGLRDYGVSGQIGQESSPREYVAALIEVFALARALLADDGTLWLNLGDSYAGSWGNYGGRNRGAGTQRAIHKGSSVQGRAERYGSFIPPGVRGCREWGIKPKDLAGIPWRVALALQAEGWYLRQDIVWHKPNPMPESVADRCTKAHEYVFLMTKRERYYFDQEAIQEPAAGGGPAGMRRRRSVWTVPTAGGRGARFAVFPPALVRPCILAGSRPGDIVFDPFLGSGTTARVALSLGRHWIGCELNASYLDLQPAGTRPPGLPPDVF
ncbi:MAG: site-specific DNA-methyltransferase [Candidatus Accumulibacter sp.]|jgi:site-specific DNA-methyltransferase (cytosine-N4-specific)|nr:site-specific DNA-methyltransferase [Accumulibacter sp.]